MIDKTRESSRSSVYFGIWALILSLTAYVHGGKLTTAGRIIGSEEPPYDEYSIAPVADCAGRTLDFGAQARRCFLDCERAPEPVKAVTLEIHRSVGEGPLIVECQKIQLTQTFTQTWTFSTVQGSLERKVISVSDTECRGELEKRCPSYECDVREPETLTPEYHYGSVTTVKSVYITLISSASMLYVHTGDIMVTPTGETKRFHLEKGIGVSDSSIYMWKSTPTPTDCPFHSVGLYGCDKYEEHDERFYACGGGSFVVTPTKNQDDVWRDKCGSLSVSEEGFLFKVSYDKITDHNKGRVAIEVEKPNEENEEFAYLRHKVQQIASKLTSDTCINRCELLTVEARLHLGETRLVRAGMDSYLLLPNGTAQFCSPNHGCRLPEKPTYCGNPPRISIVCNGYTRYWNPLLPYTQPGTDCERPDQIEDLKFNLGTTHYSIESGLKIKVHNSEYHHKYVNEFLRYHNQQLEMNVKSLKELSDGWRKAKLSLHNANASESRYTKVDSPQITIGDKVMKLTGGVMSLFRSAEAVVGTLVILVVVILSITLIVKLMNIGGMLKRQYRPVNDVANKGNVEMVWI